MAIFRARDVSQLSDVELVEHVDKLRMELIQYHGKVSAGDPLKTLVGFVKSAGPSPG
jgi:hypothetical protein